MDLLFFVFNHAISFIISSIPLIIIYIQVYMFKFPPKKVVVCIILNLIISVYFWIRLGDFNLALYQLIPYVSGFIYLLYKIKFKNNNVSSLTKQQDWERSCVVSDLINNFWQCRIFDTAIMYWNTAMHQQSTAPSLVLQ